MESTEESGRYFKEEEEDERNYLQTTNSEDDERQENIVSPINTNALKELVKNSLLEYAVTVSVALEELRKLPRNQEGNILDLSEQVRLRSKVLTLLKRYEDQLQIQQRCLGESDMLETAFQVLGKLDFNTPENGAVFWTGFDKANIRNQDTAMKYARSKNKKTIEMTRDGKMLDQLGMYEADSPIATMGKSKVGDMLFDAASTKFAKEARGEVVVFIYKPESAEKETEFKKSAYHRIERPLLLKHQENGLVTIKELTVPPEATLCLLNEIDQKETLIHLVKRLATGEFRIENLTEVRKLEERQLKLEAKETDLMNREAALAKATLQSQNVLSAVSKAERCVEEAIVLQTEKKRTAEEREVLIKKIENLLGINTDVIEEPIITDEVYENIGRKAVGKLALDSPFENITPEEKESLETRLDARERADQCAVEAKKAWTMLKHWERKHSQSETASVATVASTFSQYSDVGVIAEGEEEENENLFEEGNNQLLAQAQAASSLSLQAEKHWEDLVKATENKENKKRMVEQQTVFDFQSILDRWTERDQPFLDRRLAMQKAKNMRSYCSENMSRWILAKEFEIQKLLATKAKRKASHSTSAAIAAEAAATTMAQTEAYQKWKEFADKCGYGSDELEELLLKDQCVVRLWNHFFKQPQVEGINESEIPIVNPVDFFKTVDEAQNRTGELAALNQYSKALHHQKMREVCRAVVEHKEKLFRGEFMQQLMELRAKANKCKARSQREPNPDWEKDRPRREVQRTINIVNVYKNALVAFEREIERLHGIEAIWENQLNETVQAYAERNQIPWRKLTHEERRVANVLASQKNNERQELRISALQKAQAHFHQAEENAKRVYIFESSRQQARNLVKEAQISIDMLKHEERLREEYIFIGKCPPEEAEMSVPVYVARKRATLLFNALEYKNGYTEVGQSIASLLLCEIGYSISLTMMSQLLTDVSLVMTSKYKELQKLVRSKNSQENRSATEKLENLLYILLSSSDLALKSEQVVLNNLPNRKISLLRIQTYNELLKGYQTEKTIETEEGISFTDEEIMLPFSIMELRGLLNETEMKLREKFDNPAFSVPKDENLDLVHIWYCISSSDYRDLRIAENNSSVNSDNSFRSIKELLHPIERMNEMDNAKLNLILQSLQLFDLIFWPTEESAVRNLDMLRFSKEMLKQENQQTRNKQHTVATNEMNSSQIESPKAQMTVFSSIMRECIFVLNKLSPFSSLALHNIKRMRALITALNRVSPYNTPTYDWLFAGLAHVTVNIQRVLVEFGPVFKLVGMKGMIPVPSVGPWSDSYDDFDRLSNEDDTSIFTAMANPVLLQSLYQCFNSSSARILIENLHSSLYFLMDAFTFHSVKLSDSLEERYYRSLWILIEQMTADMQLRPAISSLLKQQCTSINRFFANYSVDKGTLHSYESSANEPNSNLTSCMDAIEDSLSQVSDNEIPPTTSVATKITERFVVDYEGVSTGYDILMMLKWLRYPYFKCNIFRNIQVVKSLQALDYLEIRSVDRFSWEMESYKEEQVQHRDLAILFMEEVKRKQTAIFTDKNCNTGVTS
jgi:hypothetical protein